METNLKKIKNSLKEICSKENFKYKHIKNHYQEMIEYYDYYSLNRKKHFLVFRFIFQKQEESISFTYHFEYNNRTKTINETHSLSNYEADKLPGLTEENKEFAKEIYSYAVEDGAIKNTVDLEKQTDKLINLFKKSYNNIIAHVKKLSKEK